MTRAALLQFPGDPFVGAYWFRNCARVWRDTVDQLDVFVNGQADQEVLAFLEDQTLQLDGRFRHQPGRLVHGEATRVLVESCEADLVMLIEDDAFIRRAGAVRAAFDAIECGATDVIGTPRGGMDPRIERAAVERWGQFEEVNGGVGPGLWPCFLFARTADLLATSRRFESWSWQPGEVIPGLDYLVQHEVQTTDTFTTTTFELRGAGKRIEFCPQHKELWHKELPAEGAPWFHTGGLSNGEFFAGGGAFGARPGIGGTNEGLDWAHRIWWWLRCVDTAGNTLASHQERYRARLEELTEFLDVRAEVEEWTAILEPWISWDDRS